MLDIDKLESPAPAHAFPPRHRLAFVDPKVKDTNPKDAVGSSKVAFHVIPWRVITGIAHAFLGGALKYRAFNYRIAGVRGSVYFAASIRHILRWWEGEDFDPDVKGFDIGVRIHHLDEAIAGLMVVRDSIIRGNWTDDRPPAVNEGWIDEANAMTSLILAANPDPKSAWTQAEIANTGPSPAPTPPAPVTSSVGADTPEASPPVSLAPTGDAGPGSPFVSEGTDASWLTETEARAAAAMPDLTGVDWNGSRDHLAHAPDKPGEGMLALAVPKEPIPTHVFYFPDRDNFYHRATKRGMGLVFWTKWRPRASEFPSFAWTQKDLQATADGLRDGD